MKTLDEIKTIVESLADRIAAPQDLLPTYGYSRGDGRWCIQIHDTEYRLISDERGHVVLLVATRNLNDVLYRIFSTATLEMARHELRNQGRSSADHWNAVGQRQIALMARLSAEWAQKVQPEAMALIEKFTASKSEVYNGPIKLDRCLR